MHYDYDDLQWDETESPAIASVELRAGDSAWNPASTKSVILGPVFVKYLKHADGGVDAEVRDPLTLEPLAGTIPLGEMP